MKIIGDGPLKETLMREIPNASFVDWVKQDVLPSIYSNSDFLLFPFTQG